MTALILALFFIGLVGAVIAFCLVGLVGTTNSIATSQAVVAQLFASQFPDPNHPTAGSIDVGDTIVVRDLDQTAVVQVRHVGEDGTLFVETVSRPTLNEEVQYGES